jgi:putative membrane protein
MILHPLALAAAMPAVAAGAAYAAGASRLRDHRVPWPAARTAAFAAAAATVVAAALLSGAAGAGHDPRVHMTQHLLLGMVAPVLIAVSAPVTLALRVLRPPARRRLVRLLRRPALRAATHPVTALALTAGPLMALYLTPLHAWTLHHPLAGAALGLHLLVAGTALAWSVAGADPVPHRPSVAIRGAVLLASIAAHTVLSRLLHADADRLAAEAGGTPDEWRSAAELMWFEGDLAELALLLAFVGGARAAPQRAGRASVASAGPAGTRRPRPAPVRAAALTSDSAAAPSSTAKPVRNAPDEATAAATPAAAMPPV